VTSQVEFTESDVRSLLTELGSRLNAKGVEGTIYIIGGAAIALEFDSRRVTADIDEIFEPATTVRGEASSMATELGLPTDWLNSNARPWVPGGDENAVLFDVPGLAIAVASPQHLLAMKMAASRPRDIADLDILFRALDIQDAEQAADLVLGIYGEYSMAVSSRDDLVLTAREILRRVGHSDHNGQPR